MRCRRYLPTYALIVLELLAHSLRAGFQFVCRWTWVHVQPHWRYSWFCLNDVLCALWSYNPTQHCHKAQINQVSQANSDGPSILVSVSQVKGLGLGKKSCLHQWLHVPERIDNKVTVLTYKVLHASAPRYLGPLVPVADLPDRRTLRSGGTNRLMVPSVRRSTVGDRAFTVAGPRV